jgi:hypothetical protein
MKPKRSKRPAPPKARPLSFAPELGADEATALCALSDAAMRARDGRAIAALLSAGSRAHYVEHAREFHEGLRPIVAAFAKSPSAEGLFRRFLPAALDPARATGDEVAVTEAEVSMQSVVRSMVKADRDMAEIFDAALRMLDPLVGASVDDVLAGLLAQMAEDLRAVEASSTPLGSRVEGGHVALTVSTVGPDGERQVEDWWLVRESDGWRMAIDCTQCPKTRAQYG